jgi:hypothetical protein
VSRIAHAGIYGGAVARLIHLNGSPGVGKSMRARRYAADHPGTLMCDIDVLRTMVGGWQRDADAEYAHLLLVTDPDTLVARFRSRAADRGDEWTAHATEFWDAAGGDDALRDWIARLEDVDPAAVKVPSTNPDKTYGALLLALGEHTHQ